MLCQHDGVPQHYSPEVHQWLPENYPGRWIGLGREAPVFWPASSPDLNPIDFFCGNILKPNSTPVESTLERNYGIKFNNLQVK
jgi:hypothetical protein